MVNEPKRRLGRQNWIRAALATLFENGVGGIKVVVLAEQMGVTSGSFYWHFKKLQDLLDAVLELWEQDLTNRIIHGAQDFTGAPEERIYNLMEQVILEGAAEPDHAISIWAKTDATVNDVFHRTIERRHDFAAWMFAQAGFDGEEARTRGRVMVAYLMGESSAGLKANPDWKVLLRNHWRFLVSKQS